MTVMVLVDEADLVAMDFAEAIVRHVELDRWAQAASWWWTHDPTLAADVLAFYADRSYGRWTPTIHGVAAVASWPTFARTHKILNS